MAASPTTRISTPAPTTPGPKRSTVSAAPPGIDGLRPQPGGAAAQPLHRAELADEPLEAGRLLRDRPGGPAGVLAGRRAVASASREPRDDRERRAQVVPEVGQEVRSRGPGLGELAVIALKRCGQLADLRRALERQRRDRARRHVGGRRRQAAERRPTERATSQAIGPPTSSGTKITAGMAAKRSASASRAERSASAMHERAGAGRGVRTQDDGPVRDTSCPSGRTAVPWLVAERPPGSMTNVPAGGAGAPSRPTMRPSTVTT